MEIPLLQEASFDNDSIPFHCLQLVFSVDHFADSIVDFLARRDSRLLRCLTLRARRYQETLAIPQFDWLLLATLDTNLNKMEFID